jgi:hypothetical protein
MLYACRYNADVFTSPDPNCENQVRVGDIGLVYDTQPASPPTVPLYRCNTGSEHFDSIDETCAGGATREGRLGFTVAYAPLVRYSNPVGWEHISTIHGAPPGYLQEGTLGFVSLISPPGGPALFNCRDGIDFFTSTHADCESKTMVSTMGWIWATSPDGLPSAPLYRCKLGSDILVKPSELNCTPFRKRAFTGNLRSRVYPMIGVSGVVHQ